MNKPNWLRSCERLRSLLDADDRKAMDEYLAATTRPSDVQRMIDLFKILPRRLRDIADLIDRRGNHDLAGGYRDAAGIVQRALDGEED